MNCETAARRDAHLKPSLYVAPRDRHDTCARCSHSARTKTELVCRAHASVPVNAGGICAKWAPLVRWVPA